MKTIPLKFIKEDPGVGSADDSSDAKESTGMLQRLVADLRGQLPQARLEPVECRDADVPQVDG